MPEVVVVLPDPRIEITFTIDELAWLFSHIGQDRQELIENITHPETGETKNIRITIAAEELAP